MAKDEDEERAELLKVIKEQELKLKELQEKNDATGFGKYISTGQFYANVPRDPFAHQYMMIHKPPRKITTMDELLSSGVLLSNIKDSRTLLLMQRDFYYLSRLFDMGERSKGVRSLFNCLYYPWEGQMRMTATLGGKERYMQSFLEPEDEAGFGFLKPKHKKKKAGKRKLTDYLTPDEGDIYE
jgi:hypothetical protein